MQTVEQVAKKFPIDTKVRFYPIAGEPEHEETTIRSAPWEMCGSIMVKVAGRAGGVCAEPEHLQLIDN